MILVLRTQILFLFDAENPQSTFIRTLFNLRKMNQKIDWLINARKFSIHCLHYELQTEIEFHSSIFYFRNPIKHNYTV